MKWCLSGNPFVGALAAMLVFDAGGRDSLAGGVSGKESGKVCKRIVNAFILPFGFRPSKRQQNDICLSHAFGCTWVRTILRWRQCQGESPQSAWISERLQRV